MRRSSSRSVVRGAAVLLALAVLLPTFGAHAAGQARGTSYPPLPQPGRAFLSNLSADPLSPGASGSVAFEVSNPTNGSMVGVRVTLAVYAFNGFPGDAVSPVPVAHPPLLTNASASGRTVNVTVGILTSGQDYRGSVGVDTSSDTPSGTFAIRTAVSFTIAGQPYRLESRGWFSASAWQNATIAPNGSATLNLTRLNVSGVVPETAVLVSPSSWPVVLAVLLAGGLILVGLGAYVYFRRGSSSKAGVG